MGLQIKWNMGALYDIRREPEVQADLEARAERIKAAAEKGGGEFVTYSQQGRKRPQGRWRVSVTAADAKAIARNRKYQLLIAALEAGKG